MSLKKKMMREKNKKEKPGLLKESMGSNPGDILGNPQEADPALVRQTESMVAGLLKLTHGEETRGEVLEILKSEEGPESSVPMAAEMIFKKLDDAEIPLAVRTSAFTVLVTDLVELGNAAGAFQVPEEGVSAILQSSLQRYIEYGVKAGIIDPIELQKQAETLMTPEQKERGGGLAQANGVPMEPTEQQAIVRSQQDATAPLKAENEKLKGLLAQAQQVGQVQGQQGQGV